MEVFIRHRPVTRINTDFLYIYIYILYIIQEERYIREEGSMGGLRGGESVL